MTVLAVDAGTTGVTALLVTQDGRVAARGYQEFAQHFPADGWVEHAPEEIWSAALEAVRSALAAGAASGVAAADRRGRSPTSARPWCCGTARRSARPRRAIVWQDRRTAEHLRASCARPATSRGWPS